MMQSPLTELIAVRRELSQLRKYRDIAGWCDAERRRYVSILAEEDDLLAFLTVEDRTLLPSRD